MVPNIRVSTDARDLLLNCCSEFIHLLASEASEVSERQRKKVISPEHVLEALATLGFPEYIEDVKAVHREYKEQASKHRRRGKSRLERLGIPEEELLRQQQQLFDEARQQHLENDMMEQQKLQQAAGLQTTPPTSSPHSEPASDPQLPSHSNTPALSSSQKVLAPQQTPAPSSSSSSLQPASLQATASLLQTLAASQASSLPHHLLPLTPAVLQAVQGSSLLQQASQTVNLLQAARATELLRQQVAAQQASLQLQLQQQLKTETDQSSRQEDEDSG
jgi:hypothetical protein